MDKRSAEPKEFQRLRVRWNYLLDEDPAQALKEARETSSNLSPRGEVHARIKASILIDAGAAAGDTKAIQDGIALFEELLSRFPKDPVCHYNLGNGFLALADRQPYTGSDWFLDTADLRQKARRQFLLATSFDSTEVISSQAFTNLGNAFWKAHRWVEAYDAYTKALEHDRTNGVALTGAAKVLLHCVQHRIGNPKILRSVAGRHLKSAQQHSDKIRELIGSQAYKDLTKLFPQITDAETRYNLTHASDYEKFVARHRLALSPTITGLDCSLKRWDSLRIRSLTESISSHSGVPALIAMFNALKSDFLAARYLAHLAFSECFPDRGLYSDTLDYAVYGVTTSILSLAQRASIDVLDKIAVATSEYLAIPSETLVYFSNRWFDANNAQPRQWHPSLLPEIHAGNTALIALAELSLDVMRGGALHQKKAYRDASTHRFTVLHDIGCKPSRPSTYIEHCGIAEFKSQLVESLQLARAAILYFVEMISIRETLNKPTAGQVGVLEVPTHQWIRGTGEEVSSHPR
jgi:tetratricopeptide (TPR) repeat protein